MLFLRDALPQVRSTLATIGRSELGNTTDASYMEVLVDTKPEDQWTERIGPPQLTKQMQEALEKAIPTVVFSATQPIQMRVEERFPAFETV